MPANPPLPSDIVWDVYDGMSHYSGIATHARELHKALLTQGLKPLISSHQTPQKKFRRIGSKLYSPISSFVQARRRFAAGERWIYHGLSNVNLPLFVPIPKACRLVLTVHDLIPLLGSGLVSRSLQLQFRFMFPRVLAKAHAVIAVSEWTKNTILSLFPEADATKIVVIENGVDHLVRPYQIQKSQRPTLLFVSRYEPYKGFDVLLGIIKEKARVWDFHIVTNEAGRAYLARNLSEFNDIPKNVMIHVGIPDEDLRKIYEISNVIFHPSLYEGFGFPVYEALSYGKSVVCLKSPIWKNLIHCPLVFQAAADENEAWLKQLDQALQMNAVPFDSQENFVKKFSLPTWQDAAMKTKKLYNSL